MPVLPPVPNTPIRDDPMHDSIWKRWLHLLRSGAVASQTGTGTTFVMQASPTLTTPILGVATGTSFQGIIGNVTPAAGSFTTLSATSTITAPAGTTAIASINIPHGAAPTAPVDGDIWTTTAGLYVRINGVTVGPLT